MATGMPKVEQVHAVLHALSVPPTYERATYGLRESNFTILTCNCCTDSARSTSVPRTVLASSVLTPHFPVDLLNDHAEHTCTILVYKDDLTGDCQLVSKMPRKAQKKSTRQDPKKRAAEDTRAASDDEVNRRCTHLQRASVSCRPRTYTLRVTYSLGRPPYVCRKNVADVATTKTYGQKARTASCDRGFTVFLEACWFWSRGTGLCRTWKQPGTQATGRMTTLLRHTSTSRSPSTSLMKKA
ncbi:hypothetical protein Bbelb_329450 [Branchiostoma belcheri]|nr:hypothetical protein Bbelb_329450 [Branchiostoma belcheri]